MAEYIVRYGEIGLKGKNRGDFERRLVRNIEAHLVGSRVENQWGQIVVNIKNSKNCKLNQIFGIVWYAKVKECKSNLKEMGELALKFAKPMGKNKSFAVRATRSDKNLAFTSRDIEVYVGSVICKKYNLKVDLEKADKTIYISAGSKTTYIFDKKLKGLGGMPVGSSGKVLVLLSGGFDSIAASYLMAKRGARVDYLHFHVFADKSSVLNSKIIKIVNKLNVFTGSNKLYLTSYSPFGMKAMDLKSMYEKHELVVFRRLMVQVAEKLAQKYKYQALVLGDSLGQVASQTMENIVAVDRAVKIPIFRPLIGMDKNEIINLVDKIGLKQLAQSKYKDCCSIVSKRPSTKANMIKVNKLEEEIKINTIINEIIEKHEIC